MENLRIVMERAIGVEGMVHRLTKYEQELARDPNARKVALDHLIEMGVGPRYLFLSKGSVPILDARHFFAAMLQELTGEMIFRGGDFEVRGWTLFLGIANELVQCGEEAMARHFESCFSPEDLGTNRMGYEFALRVKRARRKGVSVNTPALLRTYLEEFRPVSLALVHSVKPASQWSNVPELGRIYMGTAAIIVERLWSAIVDRKR